MPDEQDQDYGWLIEGVRDGDERAMAEFCRRYQDQLQRLADRHMAPGLRRRVGASDVVQSVCRTFIRRTQGGEFELADSESLWRLLSAITLAKVRQQARFHLRQKRGIAAERHLDSIVEGGRAAVPELAAGGPTPSVQVEFADQFERLLSDMPEDDRKVLDLKLQQCTNDQIAEAVGCSERTVRRILTRIRSRLAREYDVAQE